MDPLRIVVRVVFAYGFALVMVRLSGHRDVKQVDLHSFIVALIIGDLFDDLFWNEVPAAQFVVAVASLCLLHVLTGLQRFHAGHRRWRAEGP